jgi:hypothetical protein
MKPILTLCGLTVLILGTAGALAAQNQRDSSRNGALRLEKEVRHELVMLPFYDVFDNFEYKVDGSTVTLMGQVTRPKLKSDAEKAVRQIEGVERVDNQVEVLPLSPNDDQIRVAVYRAIYGTPGPGSLRHASRAQHPYRCQERSCVLGGRGCNRDGQELGESQS